MSSLAERIPKNGCNCRLLYWSRSCGSCSKSCDLLTWWELSGLEGSHIHFKIQVLDTVPLPFRKKWTGCVSDHTNLNLSLQLAIQFSTRPYLNVNGRWQVGKVLHHHSCHHWAFPRTSFTKRPQMVFLGLKKTYCLKITRFPRTSQIPLGRLLHEVKCHLIQALDMKFLYRLPAHRSRRK